MNRRKRTVSQDTAMRLRKLMRVALSRPRARERRPADDPERWIGQSLQECAASLASVLGMNMAGCSGSSLDGWTIELDDRNGTTVSYKMVMADKMAGVEAFLRSKVVAPPWGLVVRFRFYLGDSSVRSEASLVWPREAKK